MVFLLPLQISILCLNKLSTGLMDIYYHSCDIITIVKQIKVTMFYINIMIKQVKEIMLSDSIYKGAVVGYLLERELRRKRIFLTLLIVVIVSILLLVIAIL